MTDDMDDELVELKNRIMQMQDAELLRIVEVEYDDYRKEAVEFAQAELSKRFVRFQKLTPDQTKDVVENGDQCEVCGGALRPGLLFSEKELTILFEDNSEERFVQALTCRRCGTVRLVVDFETDVEG